MMQASDNRNIVLVVDDSPDTLRMLTDAIEAAGMTVLVATEGAQALSMTSRVTPDVVLMDAVMPGMDGFETCRRLRRIKALAHVPVIFMTGLTETEDVIKGFNAGGVDYVTKPIEPDELLARIRVHLANARMAHSARAALDASGRYLFAVNAAGRILWSTPQAARLLATAIKSFETDTSILPPVMREWLQHRGGSREGGSLVVTSDAGASNLELSYVGRIGPEEILLRLIESSLGSDETLLRGKLALTQREAEVLLWIMRGKSNRDIGEILKLSPRTVNKHLEQIYTKLGVENRASAAALAVRTVGGR
jgi:DNA-binding response OmpR family regulator/DNA-binding CsgD family transcriptional regulator